MKKTKKVSDKYILTVILAKTDKFNISAIKKTKAVVASTPLKEFLSGEDYELFIKYLIRQYERK